VFSPASSRSPKGDAPVSHWFRLGRALTPVANDSVLVSWFGLDVRIPDAGLVMRAPAGSLLDQTARTRRAPPDRLWR